MHACIVSFLLLIGMIVLILMLLLQLVCCQDIITTIAGTGASNSYSGDNGQATSATFYYPLGLALDSSGIFHLFVYF